MEGFIAAEIFGEGEHLTPVQAGIRAVAVFLITLFLIRLAGKRAFGMQSPFDIVITILLGALLSRAVIGISPFWATVSGAAVLVVMHRLFAWGSLHNKKFSRLIKSKPKLLYRNGRYYHENMKQCMVTESDLLEEIRMEGNAGSPEEVESVYMECNGKISVVKKPQT